MSELVVSLPQVGTPYQQGSFPDLLGGLNDAFSDEIIARNELSAVRNYIPNPEAARQLKKRDGLTRVSAVLADSGYATSIHNGIHDIWAYMQTDVVNDAGTAQSLGMTSSTSSCWASFNNLDIVVNGTEEQKYNGAAWAALGGTPPNFKYIAVYNRFLFGCGHDGAKVRWSNPDDPDTWDSDNEWNLAPDANDDATGMARYKDFLMVFCDYSFYHLRGYDEKLIQISHRGEPGCTSNQSICPSPYGVYWWSVDGIYWSPDGYTAINISELEIPQTIDGLNKAKFGIVHGVWNPRKQRVEFYVCNGGATLPNLAIFYYPRIGVSNVGGVSVGSFWVCDGAGVTAGASGLVTVSGEEKVYLGDTITQSYIYEATGSDDDGTAISAYLETKRDATEYGPFSIKRTKMLAPSLEADADAAIDYGVYLDNEGMLAKSWSVAIQGGAFELDVDSLDVGVLGGSAINETEIGYSQKFNKIKHRISDDSSAQTKVRGIHNHGYIINV